MDSRYGEIFYRSDLDAWRQGFVTGQFGDVMKEPAQAAYSCPQQVGLNDRERFEKSDIHHILLKAQRPKMDRAPGHDGDVALPC